MSGNGFEKEYSEESFWKKVMNFAKKAGGKIIYIALLLYYAAQRPETPVWAKTVVYGALGYFICPIDAVPDVTPFVGFTDDFGVLVVAITTCAAFINQDVKDTARNRIREWFGDEILNDIDEVETLF
ncbi:MAG TPA: YkvA family protein [Methylomusa anaerophila]|uniref:DUF1232 domain-containing protein n=1 Tax=Methylomusa anaerophila TaxID=1930071 RepID=A0A348AGS2_9FIRM|nr:YkvA family protein [Methylomusa anaerophila]BBB90270.1 hypothetical protein MAMMFC1_00918 [Methylomusa anaerophila]HML89384.1 YkvA family protein [Methylomusa anaerophila]